MANLDIVAFLGARQAAVGLDDLAELGAAGPIARAGSELDRFWQWVDDPTPPTESPGSLGSTLHHLATFWEARERPNVVLLRYEELKADLGGVMGFLADRLGITVPEDRWPELVDAATFDRMRERADEVAPGSAKAIWHDNRQFFHRGTTGQWRDLLGPADLERYDARIAELASPDLAAWVHGVGGL